MIAKTKFTQINENLTYAIFGEEMVNKEMVHMRHKKDRKKKNRKFINYELLWSMRMDLSDSISTNFNHNWKKRELFFHISKQKIERLDPFPIMKQCCQIWWRWCDCNIYHYMPTFKTDVARYYFCAYEVYYPLMNMQVIFEFVK